MIYTYLIGFLPVVIVFAAMPYLTRKDNFFGISAPESFYIDERAQKMRRAYSSATVVIGIVFVLVLLFGMKNLTGNRQAYLSIGLLFAMILLWSMLYLFMHKKAKTIKAELKWSEKTESSVVADTTFYSKKIAVSRMWFIAYAVIIILTIVIGFYFYPDMPEDVLIRTNADGSVEYAQKSYSILFMMPFTQLIISMVFWFVYYSLKRARPELSADSIEESSRKNAKHRYAWSCFTVFGGMAMLLLFALIQLEFLGILSSIAYIGSIVFTGALILTVIVLSVTYGQSGSRVKPNSAEGRSDVVKRDDDDNWKMGMFYFNRNDPSLFVEKRFGIGLTVNFAHYGAWIFIGVILAIVVYSIISSR